MVWIKSLKENLGNKNSSSSSLPEQFIPKATEWVWAGKTTMPPVSRRGQSEVTPAQCRAWVGKEGSQVGPGWEDAGVRADRDRVRWPPAHCRAWVGKKGSQAGPGREDAGVRAQVG